MKAHELAQYLLECDDIEVYIPDDIEGEVRVMSVWLDTGMGYIYLSGNPDTWGWASEMKRMFPREASK